MILQPTVTDSFMEIIPRFEEGVDFAENTHTYDGDCQVTPGRQAVTLYTGEKYVDSDITVLGIPDTYLEAQTEGTQLIVTDPVSSEIESVQTSNGVYVSTAADTVTANTLLSGETAHDAQGEPVTGAIERMEIGQVVTDSVILHTAGKYLESDIYVNCDADRARTGTFSPEENTQTLTLTGVTSYKPTSCTVVATSLGSNSDLYAAFYVQGLGLWYNMNTCSITATFQFVNGGVSVTLPDGICFRQGMTYRWYLYR